MPTAYHICAIKGLIPEATALIPLKGRVEINKNFSYANSQDLAEVEGHEDYH